MVLSMLNASALSKIYELIDKQNRNTPMLLFVLM